MRSREEILNDVYSKPVIAKGNGGIPDKVLAHSQYRPIEGGAAQLEVLLDMRDLLCKDNQLLLEQSSGKKVSKGKA